MLRAEMDTKINELRSAMTHRLKFCQINFNNSHKLFLFLINCKNKIKRNDLQTSENSRLQASIASLKSENSQLNKKLVIFNIIY